MEGPHRLPPPLLSQVERPYTPAIDTGHGAFSGSCRTKEGHEGQDQRILLCAIVRMRGEGGGLALDVYHGGSPPRGGGWSSYATPPPQPPPPPPRVSRDSGLGPWHQRRPIFLCMFPFHQTIHALSRR